MSRTVIRGLSEAYGSWKTIWMSRRTGRICLRLSVVMSLPSKTMRRPSARCSLMIVRPSVVLPQPDSPTTPSVSPGRTVRSTPSTARTCPTVCLKSTGLDREVLDEPFDAEKGVAVGRGAGCERPRRPRSRSSDGLGLADARLQRDQLLREMARGRVRGGLASGKRPERWDSLLQIARPCDSWQRG